MIPPELCLPTRTVVTTSYCRPSPLENAIAAFPHARSDRSKAAPECRFASKHSFEPSHRRIPFGTCVGVFRTGPTDTKPEFDKVLARTRLVFRIKTTCIGKVEKLRRNTTMMSFAQQQDPFVTSQPRDIPSPPYVSRSTPCPMLTSPLDLFR